MNDAQAKTLIEEVGAVKKLLILQLLSNGTKQKDIAQMLDVSEATMSRMIPKGVVKKIQSLARRNFSSIRRRV